MSLGPGQCSPSGPLLLKVSLQMAVLLKEGASPEGGRGRAFLNLFLPVLPHRIVGGTNSFAKNVLPQTSVEFALLSGWQLAVLYVCVLRVGVGVENEITVRVQPDFRGLRGINSAKTRQTVSDARSECDREVSLILFLRVFLLSIIQVGIKLREML